MLVFVNKNPLAHVLYTFIRVFINEDVAHFRLDFKEICFMDLCNARDGA